MPSRCSSRLTPSGRALSPTSAMASGASSASRTAAAVRGASGVAWAAGAGAGADVSCSCRSSAVISALSHSVKARSRHVLQLADVAGKGVRGSAPPSASSDIVGASRRIRARGASEEFSASSGMSSRCSRSAGMRQLDDVQAIVQILPKAFCRDFVCQVLVRGAQTRTSVDVFACAPTGRTAFSWIARSSLTCMDRAGPRPRRETACRRRRLGTALLVGYRAGES